MELLRARSGHLGLLMAALTLSGFVLAGCGNTEMFSSQGTEQWFTKPFVTKQDWASSGTAKNPNELRPVAPEDFVDASGRCGSAALASAPVDTVAGDLGGAPAPGAPTVNGGIALTMTECEVAARAGAPSQVNIGANAGGERTAVLTYMQGPWPGMYKFTGGRLAEVERVAEPEQPKPAPRKKKSAKPKTAAR